MLDLMNYWTEKKLLIDKKVDDFVSENKEWEVVDIVRYVTKDGKRFRGMLLLLVSESLGSGAEKSLDGALAVEILHASSLALDDIIDQDLKRRGEDSAWVVYGNKKVILTTNFLIPTALKMISRYGGTALKMSLDLWRNTGLGALKDLFEDSNYMETIELKTSSLFELSTVLGAICAGREDLVNQAFELGRYLGLQYQIIDDFIDLVRLRRGDLDHLVGSASTLYRITAGNADLFVKRNLEEFNDRYLKALEGLGVRREYEGLLKSIPSFFIAQLEKEETEEK
jgi:geranylgeranyl pyrophosphate synthase